MTFPKRDSSERGGGMDLTLSFTLHEKGGLKLYHLYERLLYDFPHTGYRVLHHGYDSVWELI